MSLTHYTNGNGNGAALAVSTDITDDRFLEMVAAAARDPEINLDRLERLLEWRDRENRQRAEIAFNVAMTTVQSGLDAIRADSKNDSTRSRFASLAAIDAVVRPVCASNGISLSFDTADSPTAGEVRVTCKISHVGGHSEQRHLDMPSSAVGPKGNAIMSAPHARGSCLTYARRYLMCLIFNLAISTDDDGNAASGYRRHDDPPKPRQGPAQRPAEYVDPRSGEVLDVAPGHSQEQGEDDPREVYLWKARDAVRAFTDKAKLADWWKAQHGPRQVLSDDQFRELKSFVVARAAAIDARRKP